MSKWPLIPLGRLCTGAQRWQRSPNVEKISYIDISSVSQVTKQIVTPNIISANDAPSRAQQLIQAGDVLISNVRPNLNAVARATEKHEGHIASTGFTILRTTPDLDGSFLFHYTQSSNFIEAVLKTATGASYPATSSNKIRSIPIPLPPLDEQRRIAEILDRIAKCRQHARNAMDAATEFSAASTLQDSQTIPFGEIATVRSGTTNPTIPENRNYPHVAPDNITPQSGRIINVKSVTEDGVTSGKYKFNKGDVLYSKIRPYLNKVSIAPFDGLCSADMYAIEPKEGYTAQFVAEVLQSNLFLTYAAKNSGRASIPKINRRALLSFPIPTATQEAVSTISRTRLIRDELINTYGKKAEKLDELYNSLATRAFAGEL